MIHKICYSLLIVTIILLGILWKLDHDKQEQNCIWEAHFSQMAILYLIHLKHTQPDSPFDNYKQHLVNSHKMCAGYVNAGHHIATPEERNLISEVLNIINSPGFDPAE